jgi:hypothetical protein
MAGAVGEIHIKGQVELERAFLELRKEVLLELKPALAEIGETTRLEAESRVGANIENIGPRWQRMRLGIIVKGVYIAPKSRRKNAAASLRPNLAPLLKTQMESALEAKKWILELRMNELITTSAAKNGFY